MEYKNYLLSFFAFLAGVFSAFGFDFAFAGAFLGAGASTTGLDLRSFLQICALLI